MLTGARVLITGGAGFIGSALTGRLLADNDVVVLDNLERNALATYSFADHPRLTLLEGDVLDADQVATAMKGCTHVVHLAAIAGIDQVIRRPVDTMRVNILGSANVLAAAAAERVPGRVMCFSTSEVFGQRAFQSSEEDHAVTGAVGEARWTYAVSKLAEEHLAMAYHHERGLPVTVVRPFNVYGPGQVGEGAMRTFVKLAVRDKTIEIHGDGSQIRAWCYVDDMVRGALLALSHPAAVGETFNIGNARAVVSVYGLASAVVRVLGSRSQIVFLEKEYADVELRVPLVGKAAELIDFVAEVDLDEGIRRTGAYYAGLAADQS